jgi:hypothetical protein
MQPTRHASSPGPNESFRKIEPAADESNLAWLARMAREEPGFGAAGDVLLLGGASLADFRLRVAQSHARHDLTPSYYSLVGVLGGNDDLITVPLWPLAPPDEVPSTNAIQWLPLADFDDPVRYPNIGVVRFPGVQGSVVEVIRRLRWQRSIIDLPGLLLPWLGFAWGTGSSGNPLVRELGIPSAVLVETAFGIAEVELTPGLAAASSCPEAIYQAAKWWYEFYEQSVGVRQTAEGVTADEAGPDRPIGRWTIRQPEATFLPPPDVS